MPASITSPLAMLFNQGIEALRSCNLDPATLPTPTTPAEDIQQIAGGLLVAMGYKEIAEDLDLEAIAVLGAAAVAGLQQLSRLEPGLHRLEDALGALEDLLRRTAPAAAG